MMKQFLLLWINMRKLLLGVSSIFPMTEYVIFSLTFSLQNKRQF